MLRKAQSVLKRNLKMTTISKLAFTAVDEDGLTTIMMASPFEYLEDSDGLTTMIANSFQYLEASLADQVQLLETRDDYPGIARNHWLRPNEFKFYINLSLDF